MEWIIFESIQHPTKLIYFSIPFKFFNFFFFPLFLLKKFHKHKKRKKEKPLHFFLYITATFFSEYIFSSIHEPYFVLSNFWVDRLHINATETISFVLLSTRLNYFHNCKNCSFSKEYLTFAKKAIFNVILKENWMT